MIIAVEFQSNIITLRFESSKRQVLLSKEETREFNERMRQIQIDARKD